MKQIKSFAQYYVDLLVRMGLVRFSMLLAVILVALAVFIQVSITLILDGTLQQTDLVRSVFFGLLISPSAVYFLSVVVDELEDSRQRLTKVVSKLEEMRQRDKKLNVQLTENIDKLNLEIEERKRAEEAREEAMQDLENEVYHREKAQLELAQQTALLRSFIDASPDLIYYRNEKGQFSGCNRAMEDLIGLREKALVGLTPRDVYSEDIAVKVIETDQQVFDNSQPLTYEQWLEYKDGRKAYFELRKVPFYARDGRRLGIVGFGREITERKHYQDALEKASRDKTVFISTISHELRTPLNGIVGLSRMLLDTKLSDEQSEYLRTIYVSATTLGNIFNDIIDLDKSDRSCLELSAQPIHFSDFVSEIENISALIAQQKGLRFSLDRLSDFPEGISVDATRLRQILWNLVGNAVKFTKQGAVNLSIGCEVKKDIAHLSFDVEDSGIGIPTSELENIFDMYYQVKQEGENLHAVGTGIGLSISRQLANLMGGDIRVESEVGEGSVFSLTISVPVCVLFHEDRKCSLGQRALSILLVEDIELNIVVAKNLLKSLGHSVKVARNGQEAIAFYRADTFDLVLLDIQLPDMSGFDVAKALREREKSLPPLVALTANLIKDRAEYQKNGMDDAISKPISVEAVKQLISSINDVNSKDFDHPASATTENNEGDAESKAFLDLDMLTAYVELMGVDPVYHSIEMFEQLMPEYIAILDEHMLEKDQEGIVSQAHKIKGAAGSLGLKRIQQVAQKAQSPELETWWENIDDWVAQINDFYLSDISTLKSWLSKHA